MSGKSGSIARKLKKTGNCEGKGGGSGEVRVAGEEERGKQNMSEIQCLRL